MNAVIEEKLYLLANIVAMVAHGATGQKRKGSNKPYYIHPYKVGELLKAYQFPAEVVCAGLLHDVVEDTKLSLEDLRYTIFSFDNISFQFSKLLNRTIHIVDGVTDVYTKEYINANRCNRTTLENLRLLACDDPLVWAVKIADILDNASQPGELPIAFLRAWLVEKDQFLNNLPRSGFHSGILAQALARFDSLDEEYTFRHSDVASKYQIAFDYLKVNQEEFINAYRYPERTN